MNILIIDNFDSFTYNLYQIIGELLLSRGIEHTSNIDVIRNNAKTVEEIIAKKYSHIIISPGPGTPEDPRYFGICEKVILHCGKQVPTLGVCLGMQGICHSYGAKLRLSMPPFHGKTSTLSHNGAGIFQGLPQGIDIMRYHSIMVDPESLPDCLEVTALKGGDSKKLHEELTSSSVVMGVKHKTYPTYGIQFHPESFATEGGKKILENFLDMKPQ